LNNFYKTIYKSCNVDYTDKFVLHVTVIGNLN